MDTRGARASLDAWIRQIDELLAGLGEPAGDSREDQQVEQDDAA